MKDKLCRSRDVIGWGAARRKGELLHSEGERGRGPQTRYARTGSDIAGASGWWYAGVAWVGMCGCEWK